MDNETLKVKIIELGEMIIFADEFGNDDHERKKMRVLFEEIETELQLRIK